MLGRSILALLLPGLAGAQVSFGPSQEISDYIYAPQHVRAVDMDDDRSMGRFLVAPNDGSGSFLEPVILIEEENPPWKYDYLVADFNLDPPSRRAPSPFPTPAATATQRSAACAMIPPRAAPSPASSPHPRPASRRTWKRNSTRSSGMAPI